jgi:hypothetical protein
MIAEVFSGRRFVLVNLNNVSKFVNNEGDQYVQRHTSI